MCNGWMQYKFMGIRFVNVLNKIHSNKVVDIDQFIRKTNQVEAQPDYGPGSEIGTG